MSSGLSEEQQTIFATNYRSPSPTEENKSFIKGSQVHLLQSPQSESLLMICPSFQNHQSALLEIDSKCDSIDLEIRPDKCYSLHLQETFK